MSAPRKIAAKPMIMPKLSAPLAAVRRQFLSAVKSLTPEAAIKTLREGLAHEKSELARLGNLAAQSWIVRQRLIALQQQTGTLEAPPVSADAAELPPETTPEARPAPPLTPAPPEAAPAPVKEAAPEGWQKLRITHETEVNGMIFFAGSTIQVQSEDAKKLISAGHAEEISEGEDAAKPMKPKRKPKAKAKASAAENDEG